MKPSIYRRTRRRPASREAVTFKKDNQPEQQFFGEATHEPFFKPAASLQNNAAVQRKCADCEKEDKVQRSPEKKEEEKKVQRTADKKEKEKVMKKEDKKEEEKVKRSPDKKEEEKKVQRAADKKEEEKVKKKEEKKEEEKVHKKEGPASTANTSATASTYISSINGKGQNMDAGVQSFYESRIGADFSDVKIHTGKEAADSAKDINAQAYAFGNHIVFNEGKYQPQSSEGKHLLAHELAHVVQNDEGEKTLRKREKKTAEKWDERQITLRWNHNEFYEDALEIVKRDTGTLFTSTNTILKFAGRIHQIVDTLLADEQAPIDGQPVTLTLRIPDTTVCGWKDFETCDYTITPSYVKPPPLTTYEKVVKDLNYCTQCWVLIWMENWEYKYEMVKFAQSYDRFIPLSQTEDADIKEKFIDAFLNQLFGIQEKSSLFIDRIQVQPVMPETPDMSNGCEGLEEGLKDACEIDQAHKLAAGQAAEGLKSTTCYGSKLDMGLCMMPVFGGVRQVGKAGKFAEELNEVNKLSKITKLAPEVIEDLRSISKELGTVVSKRSKTVAVGAVKIDGNIYYVYTVSRNWTSPKLRAIADKLGIARWQANLKSGVEGFEHAEQVMIEAAEVNNMKLLAITPTRAACPDCILSSISDRIQIIDP
jgi:hypothetical protein